MNIFDKNCYRQIIKGLVKERKRVDPSYSFQRMAEAVRIPKTYISKVLNGKADFSQDQIYLVSRYMDMSEEASQYLSILVERERTTLTQRRTDLDQHLEAIRKKAHFTESHLSTPELRIADDRMAEYFLDPLNQIVHMCLSIPKYCSEPSNIARDLKIPVTRLSEIMSRLERLEIIAVSGDKITPIERYIHLQRQSSVYPAWRSQIRSLSEHRLKDAFESDYSFTAVASASVASREKIRQRILRLISEAEKDVRSDDQDTVFQLNIDLLSWTDV